jgi:hypothetical protein
MVDAKNETPAANTEAQAEKPAAKKAVVAKKQRYFVPDLGRTVEAESLDEVAEIVKKEKAGEGK